MDIERRPTMKTFSAIAISSALVFSLAACAPSDNSSDPALIAPSPSASSSKSSLEPAEASPEEIAKATEEISEQIQTITPTMSNAAGVAWEALMSADGEYAAAASYQAVIDKFGAVEPYTTILEAELRHISALIRQLEREGVAVPDNPYIGQLPAPESLQIAAEAWATGEIKNVEMYDQLLAKTTDSNLIRVLSNLRRSSLESHLPLFTAAAENGGTLTPEQMTATHG